MESDCRLTCDMKRLQRHSKILYIFVILLTIFTTYTESLFVDCEATNKIAKCLCEKADVTEIDCPIIYEGTASVNLKVISGKGIDETETILRVTCDNELPDFKWDLIHGVDLTSEKIGATISKVEMQYCPLVNDGLEGFFTRINITAKQLTKFTFISKPRNVSTIPASFLAQMTNLETLNLNMNNLEEIPDLSHLPNLKILNLRDNKLTNIPVEFFSANQKLESLALSRNKISQIEPKTFPESLKFLEITSNNLSILTNETFSGLKNLRTLILDTNPLEQMQPNCFDNLIELRELFLKYSRMKIFPNLRNLPKLTNISMMYSNYGPANKPLSGPVILKDLPSLLRFEARQSKLTSLPIVSNVPKLDVIDLRKNHIKEMSKDFFKALPFLRSIDLSDNEITNLTEIVSPRLEKLDLSKNQIKNVPKQAFQHLSRLEELKLSKNMIEDVDHNAFESLYELIDVDLSYNKISFSNNPYAGIGSQDSSPFLGGFENRSPLRNSPKLRKIMLSHNLIDDIKEDWRVSSTSLRFLDLSYNKLKYLYTLSFDFESNQDLKVNFTHNEISVIDVDKYDLIFKSKRASFDFYLDNNPLDCDCYAYFIKSIKSKTHRLHYENLRCSIPDNLQGMRLLDVPDRHLQCQLKDGCPKGKCDCWRRQVDETIIIDCANRGLTQNDLPTPHFLDWNFIKTLENWDLELNYSTNSITEIKHDYISSLPIKVKLMDLTRNKLSSIAFLTSVRENATINFSLMNNPFRCDSCKEFVLLWATQSSRIIDNDNVTCESDLNNHVDGNSSQKTSIKSISTLIDSCHPAVSAGIQILLIVIAVLFVLCIVLAILVAQYAWVLKAFLYSKGWGWLLFWDNDIDAEDEEKLYDAFVSFSHKDEAWVVDELVNRLETEEGFKLCLHFRDWTPGDWIPDQIVKSVDQSKRTVVILSKNFVESVWSRLEFKAAHAQALSERSNRVILILIEDGLKDQDVQDDDLRIYMKMNTYLKSNDPWFWHKLKYALPHRKPQVDNSEDILKKVQQRERAIHLDKLRAKLEQTV